MKRIALAEWLDPHSLRIDSLMADIEWRDKRLAWYRQQNDDLRNEIRGLNEL